MPAKKSGRGRKIAAAIFLAIVVAAIGVGLWFRPKSGADPRQPPARDQISYKNDAAGKVERSAEPRQPPAQGEIRVAIQQAPVIDYQKVEEEPKSKDRMAGRKAEYGVDKGVDLIVKPGESFKIGEATVSMEEILDRIRLKKGELSEKDIGDMGGRTEGSVSHHRLRETPEAPQGADTLGRWKEAFKEAPGEEGRSTEKGIGGFPPGLHRNPDRKAQKPLLPDGRAGVFGIYIVRSTDNVWNIHFAFLREYFDRKGVALSPLSDEPDLRGRSTGVGKLLKFSENMVYIYNLREKRLSPDLNLIHPLEKIVVFDMGAIFSVLDRIDYRNLHEVQFDGQIIWLPAEKPEAGGQRLEDRNGKNENRN